MTDKPGGKRGRKPRAAPPNLLASLMDEWVHLGRMILDYRADVESMDLHEQAARGEGSPGSSTPEGLAALKRRVEDSELSLAGIRDAIEKRWRDRYDEAGGELDYWNAVAQAIDALRIYMEAAASTNEDGRRQERLVVAEDFVRRVFNDLHLPIPDPLLTERSRKVLLDAGAKRSACERMGETLSLSERGLRYALERFCSTDPEDNRNPGRVYPDPNGLPNIDARGRRWVWKNEDAETSADALIDMLREVLHAHPIDWNAPVEWLPKLIREPARRRFGVRVRHFQTRHR